MSERLIPVSRWVRAATIFTWAIMFALAGVAVSILVKVPLVFPIAGLIVGLLVGVSMDRRAMRDRRGVE